MTEKVKRHAIVQIRCGPMACKKAIVAPGQTLRVGRADSVGFTVAHDPKLADAHFEVSWDGSKAWLKDLGTRTGTFLGGHRVEKVELSNGSWLRAGHTDFSVYFERATPPKPTPTPDSLEMAALKAEALRVLREQQEPLYTILDAARSARILELLRESVEDYWSLYEGPQGDALSDVAPYLVGLTPASKLLEALVYEGWRKSWGVYLTCPVSPLEIRRHFRKLLMVEMEDVKGRLYFRFYDPRVLPTVLATCSTTQRKELFGPIKRLLTEAEPADAFETHKARPFVYHTPLSLQN